MNVYIQARSEDYILQAPMVRIFFMACELPFSSIDSPRWQATRPRVTFRCALRRRLCVRTFPINAGIGAGIRAEFTIASGSRVAIIICYLKAVIGRFIAIRVLMRSVADTPLEARFTLVIYDLPFLRLLITLYGALDFVSPSFASDLSVMMDVNCAINLVSDF